MPTEGIKSSVKVSVTDAPKKKNQEQNEPEE